MATKNKHRERSHRSYKHKDQYKQYVTGKSTLFMKRLLSRLNW